MRLRNRLPLNRTAIWQKLLAARVPLAGHLLGRLAIHGLAQAVKRDDPSAVHTLVTALRAGQEALSGPILAAFCLPLLPACHDQLWKEWAAARLPALEDILVQGHTPASPGSSAWAISLARLGETARLQTAAPARVAEMVALLVDTDAAIASTARAALSKLAQQASRDELYRLWAESRSAELWTLAKAAGFTAKSPPAVRVLYLLKAPEPDEVLHCPAELVPPLVAALRDPDPDIATQARRLLPLLQKGAAIDALCRIWQADRSALLGEVIRSGRLVASRPPDLRLLSALQAGRGDLTRQVNGEDVRLLLAFVSDADIEIAAAARAALSELAQPASRRALCQLAVDRDDPLAYAVALAAGYRPEQADQRALFLFLGSQWEEYAALDFDCRCLRAIYETGQPVLRQRIARQVQRSGQSAYLVILDGLDYRSNAARLTAEDVKLLVDLLVANREWPRLWALVHLLAFPWGMRILQALAVSEWQPEEEPDRVEFVDLCRQAQALGIPERDDFNRSLPPAVCSAVVRVSGRVNDVRFAPHRPQIAIGTGNRKLALWNFQKASIEKVRRGFNHSISQVAFVEDECLVCGVRSNSSAACMIYGWQGDDAFVLPGHLGAVTALCSVGSSKLLSAGRDGAVILWSMATRSELVRWTQADWTRSAAISTDYQRIALLGSALTLLRLPDLADCTPLSIRKAANSAAQKSMALSVAFVPGEDIFLSGQRNGQVILYQARSDGQAITRKFLFNGRSPVVGLEFLPSQPILVSAVQAGRLELRHWPDLAWVGSLNAGAEGLTSLHISPDGCFMAVGTTASTVQLWDLRVLALPRLFDLPLANAVHEHLGAVTSLLHSSALPAHIRPTLELLACLLRRRFRFDIQLDELPQIQPGEFDILLD
jgi:WD40 repeat protein